MRLEEVEAQARTHSVYLKDVCVKNEKYIEFTFGRTVGLRSSYELEFLTPEYLDIILKESDSSIRKVLLQEAGYILNPMVNWFLLQELNLTHRYILQGLGLTLEDLKEEDIDKLQSRINISPESLSLIQFKLNSIQDQIHNVIKAHVYVPVEDHQ